MQVEKVKISEIKSSDYIIKPNYHLNYGKLRITTAKKNNAPFELLNKVAKDVFTCIIFKRIFVNDVQFGTTYISAQHMMDINPLETAKIVSNKFTPQMEHMTLKENQILVSCAGTVGNVRLINKNLVGVIGSQDIIRIGSDETKLLLGYLYAYLATPTAYNYIQSFIYGSVVPRIEPDKLAQLPVLLSGKKKMSTVHEKIIQAYEYRNKAIDLLNEAISSIESYLPPFNIPKIYTSKISELNTGRKRIDATYSNEYINRFYEEIERKGHKLSTIKKISKAVFTPDIFKRIKTENNENSIPYLGGAELLEIHPKFNTFLSKRTKNIEEYILNREWLAIQDSGSIQSMGYVSIIPSYLDGVSATNNLVRVVPNKTDNYNFYIYAFLKSKQGNGLLKCSSYGTGQLHIDNKIIEDIRIPIIPGIFKSVTKKVQDYLKGIERGYELEAEAIQLIENEITIWQK
jgi:type I restriction enzyme S subunit